MEIDVEIDIEIGIWWVWWWWQVSRFGSCCGCRGMVARLVAWWFLVVVAW